MDLYLSPADTGLMDLARNLTGSFKPDWPNPSAPDMASVSTSTSGSCSPYRRAGAVWFSHSGYRPEPEVKESEKSTESQSVFQTLPATTANRMVLGMDIGGTDIKLAVSIDGQLAVCKEYDWFPALYTQAEQLIDPVLLFDPSP